jgi:hypothetical protein
MPPKYLVCLSNYWWDASSIWERSPVEPRLELEGSVDQIVLMRCGSESQHQFLTSLPELRTACHHPEDAPRILPSGIITTGRTSAWMNLERYGQDQALCTNC